MFGKHDGFVSKARVSACMYFLVIINWQSRGLFFPTLSCILFTTSKQSGKIEISPITMPRGET